MKILYNLEPVGLPEMFTTSLEIYKGTVQGFFKALTDNNDCKSIISERAVAQAVKEQYNLPNVICLTDNDYYKAFNDEKYSLNKMVEQFYTGNIPQYILDNLYNLYRKKLGSWIPDIIISIEFHNKIFDYIFPEAQQITFYGGIFKRGIVPPTFSFDPIGSAINPFFNNYINEIDSLNITDEENCIIENLKNNLSKLIEKYNPIKDLVNNYKKQFDYLLLLPCQFNNHYGFDTESDFKTQWEMISYVMRKVPPNVGVIVTEHGHYKFLKGGVFKQGGFLDWFNTRYKNFIYIEELNQYSTSSLWLMPYIDGVINTSSNVGLLSIMFNKKVFDMGKYFNKSFRDSVGLNNIIEDLNRPGKNRNSLIYWLLTRYNFYPFQYNSQEWLNDFFNLIEGSRIDFRFFEENISIKKASEYILNFTEESLKNINFSKKQKHSISLNYENNHVILQIFKLKIKFKTTN